MSHIENNPARDSQEEYFDNRPTGIDVEYEENDTNYEPEPWDPDKIRIHTKHYSLRQIIDAIEDKDIDLVPDFQRKVVWKDRQRWELIESLLLGIPLPMFYFSEDKHGHLQIVDGVQRLNTIYDYVKKQKFSLGDVPYLKEVIGQSFDQLSPLFRRRIYNTQLVAHVIDPQTPIRVKFDIFKRLNTGGTPLSSHEIRHCMSQERSRLFLSQLTQDEHFLQATGKALVSHPRMADREIVLRFCAFRIFQPEDYAKYAGLDDFLWAATTKIDHELDDNELNTLYSDFSRGMAHSYLAFGEYAFRRWVLEDDRKNPINRALLETWGNILANHTPQSIKKKRQELQQRARKLMTDDDSFKNAVFWNTGKPSSVVLRFKKVEEIAHEVLEC